MEQGVNSSKFQVLVSPRILSIFILGIESQLLALGFFENLVSLVLIG